jgi:hypothetical protein
MYVPLPMAATRNGVVADVGAAGKIESGEDEKVIPVDTSFPPLVNDPIGIVSPGDEGGLATLVVRSLGRGDSGVYDTACVDTVKALQASWGLEPDGVVSGYTWPLILRSIRLGAMGQEVQILRNLLADEQAPGPFDLKLQEAVKGFQLAVGGGAGNDGYVTLDTWVALIASHMVPVPGASEDLELSE